MKVLLDHTIYNIEDFNPKGTDSINYKGSATADTAFIFASPSADLDQDQQQLIENIITKGLNLDMSKVLLININLSAVKSFNKIAKFFPLKNIVFLGLKPSEMDLNLDIVKNDVVNFSGKKLLFTDALDTFIQHKDAKMAFWLALQHMFKLK